MFHLREDSKKIDSIVNDRMQCDRRKKTVIMLLTVPLRNDHVKIYDAAVKFKFQYNIPFPVAPWLNMQEAQQTVKIFKTILQKLVKRKS